MLWKLDAQARDETTKHSEIAKKYNQAVADRDHAKLTEYRPQYDLLNNRPARKRTFSYIEKHQKSNPLAALALQWLVPEPLFASDRVRAGQREDGTGLSPDFNHSSWIWWKSDRPQGAIGHYNVRGPEIGSHFEDWQNWRPGRNLFDCATPWNRLPRSFKSVFMRVWRQNFDLKDAYEFKYIHPPRKTDSLSRADFERYLEFLETVMHHRLFAISPAILTTKDVGEVFARLQNRIKRNLPENRDHFFGTETAWNHYFAIKEGKLSLLKHIVGHDHRTKSSTENTAKVRNNRRNVQFGVKAVEEMIALIYPEFELNKILLIHSAPPRDNAKRRKPQMSKR